MSPVTTELFIFFCSMVNIQIVVCSNDIVKYILKYGCKIDKVSRVIAAAGAHFGNVWVGSQFLHNTKIATSAINEEKQF